MVAGGLAIIFPVSMSLAVMIMVSIGTLSWASFKRQTGDDRQGSHGYRKAGVAIPIGALFVCVPTVASIFLMA